MWVAVDLLLFWKAHHAIIAIPLTWCLWISAASRDMPSKKYIFFLCAIRSSFPGSLPLLPFPLIRACTGLEVQDSTTVEQQPFSKPEEDVGVESLWKAAIWNGIQGRFSAAAGSEARFHSVFTQMTAHITLWMCVHMRLAVPDSFLVTYVTFRLSYSESWPSIIGHSFMPLQFSRPEKIQKQSFTDSSCLFGWNESCSCITKETFYDRSCLSNHPVITRSVLRRQATVLWLMKINSPIWMPLLSHEAQKLMTPSKPVSPSKLPRFVFWKCWCRCDHFCLSASFCLSINQGAGTSKRLNKTSSRVSGISFVSCCCNK